VISIEEIKVSGSSQVGPFEGVLRLGGGLNVVSARNSFGKSLTGKALAWCLAVEPMFGIGDNEPLCFPEAVRARIDFGEQDNVPVNASECSISLLRDDGEKLTLTRNIIGDTSSVRVARLMPTGEWEHFALNARKETMQDETGGLQNFLFRWFGLPRQKVPTYQGMAEVYLENLSPLFYIDQDEGWTNIQALQISRYQQQRISEIAVEYILGALGTIQGRVQAVVEGQREAALRERARSLAARVASSMLDFGWSVPFSGYGTLEDTVERWKSRRIKDLLASEANVHLEERRRTLIGRIDSLKTSLSKEPLSSTVATVPAEVSQKAIDLKKRRHDLSSELNSLRIQTESTSELLDNLEHRIVSASDLLRYKTLGIGKLEENVECPTCHRHLGLETFSLQRQSSESVSTHVEALKRDRNLVRSNLAALERSSRQTAATLQDVTDELRNAETALREVNEVSGSLREQIAKLALDLANAERQLERLNDAARVIAELEAEVQAWLKDAMRVQESAKIPSDIESRKALFTNTLFEYLHSFGHSAVTSASRASFALDDQYTPYLDGRRLRSLGSTSDQSRLVAAYTVALAVTSQKLNGLHPGFVVLDEPLQQNPDDPHRELFLDFLKRGLPEGVKVQVLVLTHLTQTEQMKAREAGTQLQTPEGEHFLKVVGSRAETKTDAAAGSATEI
jgi:hypothetical protein